MSEMELVDAIKSDNIEAVKELVAPGLDLTQQDKQGWTPLNWAAAKGNLPIAQLLLDKGADPFAVGRDLRTPQMIALAAGHADMVRLLREAEAKANPDHIEPQRKYCCAYHLSELRQYQGWTEPKLNGSNTEADPPDPDADEIVFLHQDYRVTKSIWPDEDVIFNDVTDAWKDFCTKELRFAVPDNLDLIASPAESSQSAGAN